MVFPNWKQLTVKCYINFVYLKDRQGMWMNLQLSYRTVSTYKYKWFVWDNHTCCCKLFLVEFGLAMYTRIIEILWHKSILLQWPKNLITCLKCDDFFLYKLHIFYSKSIIWEYISCFTMHVELFLQFNAKVCDKMKVRAPQ